MGPLALLAGAWLSAPAEEFFRSIFLILVTSFSVATFTRLPRIASMASLRASSTSITSLRSALGSLALDSLGKVLSSEVMTRSASKFL